MDLNPLRPWNTHWEAGHASTLLVTFPQPRSSVPYWVAELQKPPNRQWAIVAGPRQVGKTTGLGHAINQLLSDGAPRKSIIYIPWDQPTVQTALGVDLDAVIKALADQHPPTADEPLYLLFDEIQELPDWSKRLKAAWDQYHPQIRVLATGSSALKLIRPVEADFPGRIQQQTIHAMKYREVLEAHPRRSNHANEKVWNEVFRLAKEARQFVADPRKDRQLRAALATLHGFVTGQQPPLDPFLKNVFTEYAVWGGYPRVRPGQQVQLAERRAHFDQAWNAVVAKDVAAVGIVKTREFGMLFQHLANNPGGKFVPGSLAKDLGVKHTTISEWKRVLEDAFLVQQLMPLKPKLTPTKSKDKAYLFDPGWYAHYRGITSSDVVINDQPTMGLLVETVLVDHARRVQYNLTKSASMPIGYVEDPEVDIAANLGSRWLLIEAKYRTGPKRSILKARAPDGALRVVATRGHFDVSDPALIMVPAHLWALVA